MSYPSSQPAGNFPLQPPVYVQSPPLPISGPPPRSFFNRVLDDLSNAVDRAMNAISREFDYAMEDYAFLKHGATPDVRFRALFSPQPDDVLKAEIPCYYLNTGIMPSRMIGGGLFISQKLFAFYAVYLGQAWRVCIPLSDIYTAQRILLAGHSKPFIQLVTSNGHQFFFSHFHDFEGAFLHISNAILSSPRPPPPPQPQVPSPPQTNASGPQNSAPATGSTSATLQPPAVGSPSSDFLGLHESAAPSPPQSVGAVAMNTEDSSTDQ